LHAKRGKHASVAPPLCNKRQRDGYRGWVKRTTRK
jgi:hypothetical protein